MKKKIYNKEIIMFKFLKWIYWENCNKKDFIKGGWVFLKE